MPRLFLIAAVIFLASCGKAKLRKYESIVMAADKFEIVYPDHKDTVLEENIAYFKDVLIQHIVPGRKHDIITDVRVDIFKSNKRTGFITMNFKSGFVNFNSESLSFGFRLTYRIGMYFGGN